MKILLEDQWKEYEKKKIELGEDPHFFLCNEAWEVFYLGDKIHLLLPEFGKLTILEIIERCCRNETNSVAKADFLERLLREIEEVRTKRKPL